MLDSSAKLWNYRIGTALLTTASQHFRDQQILNGVGLNT